MERIRWDEETSRAYVEDIRKVARYDYPPWAGVMELPLAGGGGPLLIADLGCGPGLMSRELAARLPRARFLLMDAAPVMLGFARAETAPHASRVVMAAAGAEAVPLKPATVDAAVCKHLLSHVDDVDRVFQEAHRILKPGGLLYVLDFCREASAARAAVLWLVVRIRLGPVRARRFWSAYRGAMPGEDLLRRLAGAGFSAERAVARGVNVLTLAVKPST